MVREVFFSSHEGRGGAGKPGGCGKLLPLPEFSSDLDHHNYGELLLSLRGTEFAGEQCRVLGLTCFDEAPRDCLSAVPT